MKLKKKSGLIGAVIALSCASLVSVGFASWVISQGASAPVDGSFLVDDVDDNRHEITISGLTGEVIKFGAPTSSEMTDWNTTNSLSGDKIWLTNDAAGYENLTVSFTVAVTNVENDFAPSTDMTWLLQAGSLNASSEFVPETAVGSVGYLKAADEDLVADLPEASDFVFGAVSLGSQKSNGKYDASFSVQVTFGWGTAFGEDNPYYYYNDGTKTASSHGDEALQNLGNLATYLEGVLYKLTVSIAA